MINTRFEAYKIQREIKRSGKTFAFKKPDLNDFGEPKRDENGNYIFQSGDLELNGIYHETNSYISLVTGDTTATRTKKEPMILCLYEDTAGLKVGDVTYINGKMFKLTGVKNIQEWSIIGDISLEVFDDGLQT